MNTNTIDAAMLSKMFICGAKNLEAKKEWINELNVFPVPDGDTGTNMTMTILSAVREVGQCDNKDMQSICKCISSGSLRGARGNSGVILSQLLRGFTKVVREHEAVDAAIMADAFDKAVETAYKAVMKPKEGTILTVAKGAAEKARELANENADDLDPFFKSIIEYAEEVLDKTPEMLPVLKQAGVVDSGGQGLVQVLKGAYDAYSGKEIDYSINTEPEEEKKVASEQHIDTENIKFGYCTEFIILLNKPLNKKQEKDFKSFLDSIGDSIVMVADDEICKIHVHTNDPGLAIEKALLYGQLSNMKIDNMRMEHREKLFHMNQNGTASEVETEISGMAEKTEAKPVEYEMNYGKEIRLENADTQPKKEFGFVAVCAGKGMADIFRGLGADYVIEGGQTMNPSTEDILSASEKVNADTVFILPNNKNIILAANQAADIASDDKKVIVIPTKTIPQGISSIINFISDLPLDENVTNMEDAINTVNTGEVTYAVRDTVIDDIAIKQGDFMGIGDSGLLSVGTDLENVTAQMIGKIMSDDLELISIYYGLDIEKEKAEAFRNRIADKYPGCDVELQYGGQPIYYYIISTE